MAEGFARGWPGLLAARVFGGGAGGLDVVVEGGFGPAEAVEEGEVEGVVGGVLVKVPHGLGARMSSSAGLNDGGEEVGG